MASFSAELRVAGHVFPLLSCTYGVYQDTGARGQARTKVRYEPVYLTLDVPRHDVLPVWAADPARRYAAALVFRDGASGAALETLSFKGAYCTGYAERFESGDVRTGSYVCEAVLIDPDGWTLAPGGPAAYVAPAAREHGVVSAVVAVVAVAAGVFADVPPHQPAPVPVPSPDHKQVHLSGAEWQALTQGRWDRDNNKKFLKKYRSTEFHVAGDPFTYRTDAKGSMVAVYDAQKSYNVTGSKKGLMGIPLTLNGGPTYAGTTHLMPVTSNQKNVVVIEMAGNRPGDFKRANEAAGLVKLVKSQGLDANEAPDGYVWHHRDDFKPKSPPNPPYGTSTMELVSVKSHRDTFVHFGSCDQCNKYFNRKLYK